MWKESVINCSESYEFFEPSSVSLVSKAESQLGLKLPSDLVSCLLETNGVDGEYGLGLVWSISRIVEDNLRFRSNVEFKKIHMPFNHILFFADAGNGDQFFYPIIGNQLSRQDIYIWNHENDSREWVAPSLEKYLEWWLSGRITV